MLLCTLHSLNWINYIQHLSYDWKQTNGIPSQKRYTESNLIHASGMLTIMCICKIIAQHCTYSNFYYLHSFTLFIVVVVVVVVSFQFSTQFQCDSFFFHYILGICIFFWIMTEQWTWKYQEKKLQRQQPDGIPLLSTRMARYTHRMQTIEITRTVIYFDIYKCAYNRFCHHHHKQI